MQRDRRNLTDPDILFAFEKLDKRKDAGKRPGRGKKKMKTTSFTDTRSETADKLGIGSTKVQQVRTIIDHGAVLKFHIYFS